MKITPNDTVGKFKADFSLKYPFIFIKVDDNNTENYDLIVPQLDSELEVKETDLTASDFVTELKKATTRNIAIWYQGGKGKQYKPFDSDKLDVSLESLNKYSKEQANTDFTDWAKDIIANFASVEGVELTNKDNANKDSVEDIKGKNVFEISTEVSLSMNNPGDFTVRNTENWEGEYDGGAWAKYEKDGIKMALFLWAVKNGALSEDKYKVKEKYMWMEKDDYNNFISEIFSEADYGELSMEGESVLSRFCRDYFTIHKQLWLEDWYTFSTKAKSVDIDIIVTDTEDGVFDLKICFSTDLSVEDFEADLDQLAEKSTSNLQYYFTSFIQMKNIDTGEEHDWEY
ncbi:MAG: hypothetical protein COC01_06830 [Bacteroidetes bacterium]|nr:MAG: hypothetical protein COC01_06830 [Bacteroidota bacterium]